MTNDMCIETSLSNRIDSPRLDLTGVDWAANMLSRLKSSNRALDDLRRALETDEVAEQYAAAQPGKAG